MKNVFWPYIIVAYASLFALGLVDNARGPIFPDLINDLKLSDATASLFFAVTSLISFVSSYWAGARPTLLRPLNGLRLGLFLIGTGFIGIAMAKDLFFLLSCCAGFGFGFGLISVYEHVAVQLGASTAIRRNFFSGLHTMYAFSALAAPLAITALYDRGYDWRVCFKIFSLIPLSLLIGSFFFSDRKKLADSSVTAPPEHGRYGVRQWLMASILAFYISAELALSTRLVLLLRREWGLAADQAPQHLAGFFLLLLIGRLIFTLFSFKRIRNETILFWAMLSSLVAFVLGLATSPAWLILCGLTMAPIYAVAIDFKVELFGSGAARVISLGVAIGSLAVVAMHYTIGWLTELYGIRWAMSIGPLCLAACVLLMIVERRVRRSLAAGS